MRHLSCLAVLLAGAFASTSARAAEVGGAIFLSGHDPDFHAQDGGGASTLLDKAFDFVRRDREGKFLFVQGYSPTTDGIPECSAFNNICAPSGHRNPWVTLTLKGYVEGIHFDRVGADELETVNFDDYAFVFIPSDFGGLLTQEELDVLVDRSADIIDYINGGGGLVAFAESGGGVGLTYDPGSYFQYLPFVVSSGVDHQHEDGNYTTDYGLEHGFVDSDFNGSFSHNIFIETGGMSVVDYDSEDEILSLGFQGTIDEQGPTSEDNCYDGVDNDSDGATDNEDDECQVCGDGDVDPGEECEPLAEGDGCNDDCTLANEPPVALCRDITLSADESCVACGSVDDGSYDPDGEDDIASITELPTCDYERGDTEVTLTITDTHGASDTCTAIVTVEDDTAPEVEAGDLIRLWPPNHKYETFSLSDCATVSFDNCDGDALDIDLDGVITAIWSDEPEDVKGNGDGSSKTDIVIVDSSTFQVRAERQGAGNGRVYGVEFEVADLSGNLTTGTCYLGVPHDNGGRVTPVSDGASAGYTVE